MNKSWIIRRDTRACRILKRIPYPSSGLRACASAKTTSRMCRSGRPSIDEPSPWSVRSGAHAKEYPSEQARTLRFVL